MDHDLRVSLIPNKGRGVFANRDMTANQIVEYAPVLVIPEVDIKNLEKTIIVRYWFRWNDTARALALGHGCLFNHSYDPNIVCYPSESLSLIIYVTLRPIKKGEELVVNYNGEPENKKSLPFDVLPPYRDKSK